MLGESTERVCQSRYRKANHMSRGTSHSGQGIKNAFIF